MDEVWRDIPGYEGFYRVSNLGRVTGHRGRVLKGSMAGDGYRKVILTKPGLKTLHIYLHRLVLSVFDRIPQPGEEACHLNAVKNDNRLSNLRWDTHTENVRDTVRMGRHFEQQKTHCPRQHPLQTPNLVIGELKRGGRKCRACNIARARKQKGSTEPLVELANQIYVQIMNGDI